MKRTILIVEDEPLLRMAAVDLVEQAGYASLEAADADSAISLLESHGEICIVFTDIDMPPGIDGIALAALINGRWPPVGIVLTSGKKYPSGDTLPTGSLFSRNRIVRKMCWQHFRKWQLDPIRLRKWLDPSEPDGVEQNRKAIAGAIPEVASAAPQLGRSVNKNGGLLAAVFVRWIGGERNAPDELVEIPGSRSQRYDRAPE